MRILGIDPGIGTMGYGVIDFDRGNFVTVDYGVVKTNKDDVLPKRLLDLESALLGLIDKFTPDEIAVEELFFTKNVTTGIAVAEARGVILLTGVKSIGDNLYEYTPNQIKQALTGYGKADKGQMQRVVASHLRLPAPPRPDDAADALAVALCHAFTSRFGVLFGIK